MAERRTIVDGMTIRYDGLFDFNELYHMIENWYRQKGYDMHEKKNFEQQLKDGRDIEIEQIPWKKITDYHQFRIKTLYLIKRMKDVVVKKDGVDVRMNQGQLQIKFIGYLETDYFNKWEGKPSFWIMRLLYDRYIAWHTTKEHMDLLTEEVDLLYNYITAYLNMQRRLIR